MELGGIGRLVEVQIAAKELVGSLARQHHLETHGLDTSGQEVHRHGRANLFERLEVIDDIGKRVQSLLGGEVDLVVDGAQLIGDFLGGDEIRRTLDADGEGVHGLLRVEGVGLFCASRWR